MLEELYFYVIIFFIHGKFEKEKKTHLNPLASLKSKAITSDREIDLGGVRTQDKARCASPGKGAKASIQRALGSVEKMERII